MAFYTCVGKGGEYAIIGETIGAGLSRGESVIVYIDINTGELFHRTPEDFYNRMRELND